jgi:hypothetical protein
MHGKRLPLTPALMAGQDYRDDEISVRPADQKAAIALLVKAVGQMTELPLAVDESRP